MECECGQVIEKSKTKMPNSKLEILNSKQTQMSLPTGRQAKHKTQNRMTYEIFGSTVEKSKWFLSFRLWICLVFRV
jgi:hypothetical protein